MHNLDKTPLLFLPSNFDFLDDTSRTDMTFVSIFLIFKKHLNSYALLNNFNNFENLFFLQRFYTTIAESAISYIKIKNKKNILSRSFLFKNKKYLFSSRFRFIYLTKFKFFKKLIKVKTFNFLKSPENFSFNFYKTPHLPFFYKKFYPLTGFFLNNLSMPTFSEFSEIQESAFINNLDNQFYIKKLKLKKKLKKKSKLKKNKILFFFKSVKFKYFKKLLLNDLFYISKKNYFWSLFFSKKFIKLNQNAVTLSNFVDLPYSRASLALSLNYKKNMYDLDKIVLFSCELLLSSFLQFRSFFLKKKKYFRKSTSPYSPRLIFGTKVFLPNFKKKISKFNAFSDFLFKKSQLFFKHTIDNNNFILAPSVVESKPKFLLNSLRDSIKKKNHRLFNKILKKKIVFFKSYLIFFKNKNKNLYFKLSVKFLKLKRKKLKKKIFRSKKNKRFMLFFKLFFANLFFKKLNLKKKPFVFHLSKFHQKSLRKKFKRFMNYLKIKRKSPSATRRSRRILRYGFRLMSLRVLKSKFISRKPSGSFSLFILKKKSPLSIILKPVNQLVLFYQSKIFQKKKKLDFSNIQLLGVLPKGDSLFFYKKINSFNNPFSLFYDFIESRINFNFTHSLAGFMYITDKIDIVPLSEEYIFHTKKLAHSFLFKNDLQNFIIKKHLKSSSNPIFSNFSFTRKSFFFILNRSIDLLDTDERYFEKTHFNFFNGNEDFSQKNKKSFFEFNSKLFWYEHKIFISYSDFLNDTPFTFSIKKIKFKPGYQKIWREARECLKTSLNLHFRYQARLTRFVNQFKKIIRNDTHLLFETQLQNVLKSSKLVPDVNWSRTFLQNGSIFINGQVVCNPFFQIYKNDFVQLVVTHAYYFFYKWLIVWSTLRKFRFKSKINHKLSKKDLPDDKQKSRSTPSWVLRYRCFTEDAAKNLEIDYLTLSFFVLYEFSNLAELDSTFLFQHRFPVINMHNWKYIN